MRFLRRERPPARYTEERFVLPFNKRQAKPTGSSTNDDAESLDSERPRSVPPPSRVPRFPAPPESRPRVFQPSLSDEEMTSILPEKSVSGVSKSLPPPRAPVARDAPPSRTVSKVKGGQKKKRPVTPPRDEDDDSRTMLRQELTPSTLLRAHEHASRAADVGHAATIPAADEVSSFPGVELGRSRNGHDGEEHTAAMVLAPTPRGGIPAAPRSQPVTYELPSAPGVSSHGAFARRAPAFPEAAPFHAHAQPAHFAAPVDGRRRDAGPTVVTHTPEKKSRSLGWVIGVLSVALVVGVAVAFFAGQQTGQAGTEASKPAATQTAAAQPVTSAVVAVPTAAATPQLVPGVAPGVATGTAAATAPVGAPGPLLNTGVDSPIAAALGTGAATVAPPVAPPSATAATTASSGVSATAPPAATGTGATASTAPPNMSTAPAPSASHASGHKSGPKSGGGRVAGGGPGPRPPVAPPAGRTGGSKTDEELKAAKAAKDLADLQLKDSL